MCLYAYIMYVLDTGYRAVYRVLTGTLWVWIYEGMPTVRAL